MGDTDDNKADVRSTGSSSRVEHSRALGAAAACAWARPSLEQPFCYVVDVAGGSIVTACRGRWSFRGFTAWSDDPPLAQRCARCELDRCPATRVRGTYTFDVAADPDALDAAGGELELGGEA